MRRPLAAALTVATVAAGVLVPAVSTADPAYLVKEATYGTVANGWSQVDRYRDTTAGFHDEQYPPDGRGDQDGQRRTFFGNVAKPSSSRFLLYSAPGWDTGSKPTPVLLVHGANDNPDRAWANPNESGGFGCGSTSCPSTGLMQYLSSRGHRVFAIGFAHKQGDNLQQAQQVGDAIAVIKSRLGVSEVDVVGWSKGMMSARMYVASVKPSWGRSYAGDVRKLITLGGPNGGYDYPFAHGWAHDFSIWPECGGAVNAPSPHTRMTCFGQYTYHPELSITPTGGYDTYPGQRQMLARWDGVYGVNTTAQDWYTTYYGGQGFYTNGPGIQAAIDAGSLIAAIRSAPTPASVPVYLLAGGSPTIVGIWNETRGPSDGVVFVASALDTTGVTTVGATSLVASANHLQLGWATAVMSTVAGWLA
ncbi:MAG: alpha/beta hydrolase [Actinophytocola sp.]|uniref:esterase/lipase family protein n=1 Tax=Actinophytocola sp. TaxID=1872138 RepID=UPI00132B1E81|nr:alpha/beta hydrolase [Actinophytocola sp.]MPZ82611.1 alpha/beta hydrolase [Actinophytocola sp.]